MILLSFRTETGDRLGVKVADGVVDVPAAGAAFGLPGVPRTVTALLNGGPAALAALAALVELARQAAGQPDWLRAESSLTLAPCVPQPGKIICIGLNYRRHALESGMPVPQTPILFSKFNNAVAAAGEAVPLPQSAEQYDYEAELAVVIGRRARDIGAAEALEAVFGYCNANDFSARDLQMRTSQWLLGKTLDKFMPIGPYLVTADELPDPQALPVRCWLNGELRQQSSTADMVFSVRQLVSYISQYFTLEPGDLILTGTPEGVILGRAEKVWLKPGDVVTVEVGPLGRLSNPMAAAR